jgi:hypothetical protein
MTALVVPIDVAALCVGRPDVQGQDPGGIAMTLAPTADFTVLPYVADGTVYNRGPYISADVLSDSGAFMGAVPLLQGIHLHWALPAGLSRGIQGEDGKQDFPSVPQRWLVTRVVVDTATEGQPAVSTRSWVVESDRLAATATAPAGLQQPTVPMAPTPGQNFRYLGASFDLAGWHEAGDTVERLDPCTAVGYGEAAFAGFYPNVCSSFGFLDTLADLTEYQPATSTVSYQVAGWYGSAASDPLHSGDVVSGDNRYDWTWSGTPAPTATVCSGVVMGVPWDPATEYLGQAPQPLTVAVADTGPEALSALMASLLDPDSPGDLERLLNALQFGLLSQSRQVDSQPAFEEAMHAAGFATLTGGSVWSVVTAGPPADAGGGEVPLPYGLADDLNALNVLQLEAGALARDLQVRRQQLFADWYKYLLVRYQPSQVPPALQDQVAAVQAYLDAEAQAIDAIAQPGGAIERLSARIAAAADVVRAQLPAGMSLSSDTAAPPYCEPTDPVLVLSGADITVAQRHRLRGTGSPGDGLPCRLDDQVVSGVTLDAGLISGSTQEVVAAGQLPGLAVLPDLAPALLLQALLREAIALAPPLQPVVAAACAAVGGSGNPAVLSFAATVTALARAAQQFVAGLPPYEVAYAGTAPDAVALQAWAGTPWLPLLLQYEVAFHPLQYIGPDSGDSYAPDFVDSSFRLPVGGVDLEYASGQPQALQIYSGAALLTDGAVADMVGEIQRFLASTGNSDPELAKVLADLQSLPLLAQRLTGAVQAMLMQSLVLQMPVSDPLASPPQQRFTAEIAAAVGQETSVAPLPEESFNPLRTGTLALRQLRIVDAFGRFKDYTAPSVVLSSALRPPAALHLPAGTAFLPPRITQASRLLFRWLAASDDQVETNSHPATTPVFGWLVPSWLDRALVIYNAEGTALGVLSLNVGDTTVLWTPAPGGPFPPAASIEAVFAGQNPHLRDFAVAVYAGGDAAFLAPFFATVRDSLDFTLPAAFRESAETAVLAGQPLALARAGLSLEVPGGTAASQSWDSFVAQVLDAAPPDDAGLSTVQFPVRLGGPQRLDDSLVGFWVQQEGETSWLTFYAPGASESQGGGVQPPAQDTITLTPQPDSDVAVVVTLLLDPRGSVHATSGVLPVGEISIPPDRFTSAIASLSLALATHPVLSPSAASTMSLALPKLSAGEWSWITIGGQQWQAAGTADAPAAAALDYTPQQISEGWLIMQSGLPTRGQDDEENRP